MQYERQIYKLNLVCLLLRPVVSCTFLSLLKTVLIINSLWTIWKTANFMDKLHLEYILRLEQITQQKSVQENKSQNNLRGSFCIYCVILSATARTLGTFQENRNKNNGRMFLESQQTTQIITRTRIPLIPCKIISRSKSSLIY